MKQYLFVYGTLKKGFAPPEIAETADKLQLVGEGFVYGSLYDLGQYRGLILSGEEKIFGQVLELPDDEETLQKLDEYEGFYPQNRAESIFVRSQTEAFCDDKILIVWIYEYNRDLSNFSRPESE